MQNFKKVKLFTIGYADNVATSYILDYLLKNGIQVDGVIFCKGNLKRSFKRLRKKIKMRGFFQSFIRVLENLIIRRKEIFEICSQHIEKIYYVDRINSQEVKDILLANKVQLLILTSTPIIKRIILDIAGLTILNAHTGWLPSYRGLDANLKAIKDGHQPGVSIHKVTKKIDAGEIYLREKFSLGPNGNLLKQIDE